MRLVKLLLFSFLISGAMLLTGCGDSPSTVTKNFCDAIIAKDYDTIASISGENIPLSPQILASLPEENRKAVISTKIISETIDGNNAIVSVKTTLNGGVREGSYYLEKIDGKWIIVDFD